MTFLLDLELAREIQSMELIPAVKMLRDRVSTSGLCLSLRVARDIVREVQASRCSIVDWSLGKGSISVKIGE